VAREALHLGIPVLASRRGALAELPLHGELGDFFPAGDAGALRALVERWTACLQAIDPRPVPSRGVRPAGEHAEEVTDLYREVLAARGER
jgi:glycosyltransferase involved in cell wall biosynthesis